MYGNGKKLELTPEGAETCREFAKSMRDAYSELETATNELKQSYTSVSEGLGMHQDDFEELINIVSKILKDSTEPLRELAERLDNTADRIEEYVAQKRTMTGKK